MLQHGSRYRATKSETHCECENVPSHKRSRNQHEKKYYLEEKLAGREVLIGQCPPTDEKTHFILSLLTHHVDDTKDD